MNNFSVAKQTPVYIRSIEAFSLRVKQLLYVNQCDSAFSVDLFKNIAKAETKKKGKNVLKSKENVKSAKKKGKGKSKEKENRKSCTTQPVPALSRATCGCTYIRGPQWAWGPRLTCWLSSHCV